MDRNRFREILLDSAGKGRAFISRTGKALQSACSRFGERGTLFRFSKFSAVFAVLLVVGLFIWLAVRPGDDREPVPSGKTIQGIHSRLGDEFYDQGLYSEAAEMYEKWLQFHPEDSPIHLRLAVLYDDYFKDEEQALRHYQSFLDLEPESEKERLVRAWMKLSGNEVEEEGGKIRENVEEKITSRVLSGGDESLQKEIRELRERIKREESRTKEQLQVVEETKTRLMNYRHLLEMKEQKIAELEDGVREKLDQIAIFKDKTGTTERLLENALADNRKQKALMSDLEQRLKKQISELQVQEEQRDRERTQELEALRSENNNMKTVLAQYEEELDAHRKRESILLKANKDLKKELEIEKNVRVEMLKDYEMRVARLKKTVESLRTEEERAPLKQVTADRIDKVVFYTVKRGDSLRSISMQFYGSREEWGKIYNANRDQLQNPNLLTPGQRLKIPKD